MGGGRPRTGRGRQVQTEDGEHAQSSQKAHWEKAALFLLLGGLCALVCRAFSARTWKGSAEKPLGDW